MSDIPAKPSTPKVTPLTSVGAGGGSAGAVAYFAALDRLDQRAEHERRLVDLVTRAQDLRTLGCVDGTAWATWDLDAANLIHEIGATP